MRKDGRRIVFRVCVAMMLALLCADHARALAVQDMVTLGGTGKNELWGLGFVVGLQGTGDSSDSIPLARQLAGLLEKGGNPVPDILELTGGKNIAMVMVTCSLPREGARKGELFDVHVQAWHNAKSLRGGRLFITPLQGPIAGQGVFAFANGPVVIDGEVETSGVVRRGAQVTWDFRMNVIDPGGMMTLVVKPEYAGWTTSKLLANTINQDRQGLREDVEEIARAMDAKSVRVRIPDAELGNPANFIGNILSIQLDPSLLTLPARVIVNERTGSIVVTGDVEISPTVISHRDLVVTTITPPIIATPDTPRVERSNVTAVDTTNDERRAARLEDLLEAMKALNVPVADRIAILSQMHAIGHLHAEFVIE